MTTIWIDPHELDVAAMALGEQAMRVQETVTGTRATCTCEVPRALVDWLDQELNAITVGALEVVLGYLQQALDIKQRAAQVRAEQSLVTTQGVLPSSVDLGALIAAGVPGGLSLVIGGGPSIVGSGPSTGGIALTIAGGPAIATGGPSWNDVFDTIGNVRLDSGPRGGGGPDLTGFWNETGDIARSWMTPPGVTFDNGQYVDEGGNRASSLSSGYVSTYTGRHRF